jgi:hypothetical protein
MITNGLENVCVQPQNLDVRMGKILEVYVKDFRTAYQPSYFPQNKQAC